MNARANASRMMTSTSASYGGYTSTSTQNTSERKASLQDQIMAHTKGQHENAICNVEVEVIHMSADVFFGLGMMMADDLIANITGTVVTVEGPK